MAIRRVCSECGAPVLQRKRKCAACKRENKGWQEAMWRATNPAKRKAAAARYHAKYPGRANASIARWRNTPRGRMLKRAGQRRYLKTIRDRQNKHNREYYARKKAADPAWYADLLKRSRERYGPTYRKGQRYKMYNFKKAKKTKFKNSIAKNDGARAIAAHGINHRAKSSMMNRKPPITLAGVGKK